MAQRHIYPIRNQYDDPWVETRVVYHCDCCGEEIYEGEAYYDIADRIYCEGCVEGFRATAEVPEMEDDD